MLTFAFIASSLPCLHTFWHAIPTSFCIFNIFYFLVVIRTPLKRSFRVEPVQPVLPASRQTINSELGQRQLLPQSSGQAFDSQQQQQQQSLESSRQAFDSGLRHHPQQQSSTESEAACQTQQEEEEEEGYCAQLYITRRLVTEWKVDFVVTKDLDSCSTVSDNINLCRLYACFYMYILVFPYRL